MRITALALALVFALALIGPASARRKHHAPLAGGSSIALVGNQAPALGDTVTFDTTIDPLDPQEYPMVAVVCFQDVNEDGVVDTNILGPDIVFSWLDHPDASFTLGAFASIWTVRGGGPATCYADLDAYPPARVLAETPVWIAAG